MTMNREKLRRALIEHGVPVGGKYDGAVATIVPYLNDLGVAPGIPGSGADTPNIIEALDRAGIGYRTGNMVMVPLRHVIRVRLDATDTADLTDEGISDSSAVVYAHRTIGHDVVHDHGEDTGVGGDGEFFTDRWWEWTFTIQTGYWPETIFEALTDVADQWGHRLTVGIVDDRLSLTYEAGDRRWAAEQAREMTWTR